MTDPASSVLKKKTLQFCLTARNLPVIYNTVRGAGFGSYHIKWLAKDTRPARKKFRLEGRTQPRDGDNFDPDFFEASFSYNWERGKGHTWRFELMNKEKHDPEQFAEVSVDSYVDDGERVCLKLRGVAIGQGDLYIQRCQAVGFKLSAQNLPKMDTFGKSDPFVECFWTFGKDGTAPLYRFHKTKVIENVKNCQWDEVVEFPVFQPKGNQVWVFKVWDKDLVTTDDSLGACEISVDDFVEGKKVTSMGLNVKSGRLILTPHLVETQNN